MERSRLFLTFGTDTLFICIAICTGKRRDPNLNIPVSTAVVPDVQQKWLRASNDFGTIMVIVHDGVLARGDVPQVPSIVGPLELPLAHVNVPGAIARKNRMPTFWLSPPWKEYPMTARSAFSYKFRGEDEHSTHPNCYQHQKGREPFRCS